MLYSVSYSLPPGRACPRSSVVEHFFGKEEVKGPIPFVGFFFQISRQFTLKFDRSAIGWRMRERNILRFANIRHFLMI